FGTALTAPVAPTQGAAALTLLDDCRVLRICPILARGWGRSRAVGHRRYGRKSTCQVENVFLLAGGYGRLPRAVHQAAVLWRNRPPPQRPQIRRQLQLRILALEFGRKIGFHDDNAVLTRAGAELAVALQFELAGIVGGPLGHVLRPQVVC